MLDRVIGATSAKPGGVRVDTPKIFVAHEGSPLLTSLIFDENNLHCITSITPENECVITMNGDETLLPDGLASLKLTVTQGGGGQGGN